MLAAGVRLFRAMQSQLASAARCAAATGWIWSSSQHLRETLQTSRPNCLCNGTLSWKPLMLTFRSVAVSTTCSNQFKRHWDMLHSGRTSVKKARTIGGFLLDYAVNSWVLTKKQIRHNDEQYGGSSMIGSDHTAYRWYVEMHQMDEVSTNLHYSYLLRKVCWSSTTLTQLTVIVWPHKQWPNNHL